MNIKQWRTLKRMTQGELGALMGRSAMTISNWEKLGVKNIDIINELKRLSKNKIKIFTGC